MVADPLGTFLRETSQQFSGVTRRAFIGRAAVELYEGVAYRAAQATGWARSTVIKAIAEYHRGECVEGRKGRAGRKPAEVHLPHLLDDIRSLCEPQSQTDPTFHSARMYTRLSAAELRRLLVESKGYVANDLPQESVLRQKMRQLGYFPQRVRKTKPKKRSSKRTRSSPR